jgi:protein-L-isoaspartate(D-aspartate) O-methyltransferase
MKTRIILIYFLLIYFCGTHQGEEGINDANLHRYAKEHHAMVRLIQAYGIKDKPVLKAMAKVRRHMYIPEFLRDKYNYNPYGDHPCPIGYKQTISQPYIVAYMTEKMAVKPSEKVLEIGTGSGYQAAILAEMGAIVYSIEIIPQLAAHAKNTLKAEGYENVNLLNGDGYQGWPLHAPYDVVIVTCAPHNVPEKLVDQLKEGGRMIIPVGKIYQRLLILRKKNGKIIKEKDLNVRFVPMIHKK